MLPPLTLNHEVPDNAMELAAIVVTTAGEFGKVATGVWGVFPVQFQSDVTHPTNP